jgi:hypothetical protein
MPAIQPRFHCRHIHVSGHRCASPSLRNEAFCYFHHSSRKPVQNLAERRGKQSTFTLPDPEDRTAIQLAIGEVLRRIAANDIDPKRAGLLLYGLQIASCNLPKETPSAFPTVDEVLYDETYGPLAPEAEFQTAPRDKSLEQILLEQWAKDEQYEAEKEAEKAAKIAALDQTIDIQAVAELTSESGAPFIAPLLHAMSGSTARSTPVLSRTDPSNPRSRFS